MQEENPQREGAQMTAKVFLGMCLVSLPLIGCAHALEAAGPPVAILVPQDQNPEVFWLVRPFKAEQSGTEELVTLYGLFACYRSSTPGYPDCYLARIAGSNEDLVWPDAENRFYLPKHD